MWRAEKYPWSCEVILSISSLKWVFWHCLMWSPLNFTAESLKIIQPLTQMWSLVLFIGAHENELPMLPWGPIPFVSSRPQWSVQTHTVHSAFRGDIWNTKGGGALVYSSCCKNIQLMYWIMWNECGQTLYYKNSVSAPSLVLTVWHLSTVHLEWALLFITPCYISLHWSQLLSAKSFELIL